MGNNNSGLMVLLFLVLALALAIPLLFLFSHYGYAGLPSLSSQAAVAIAATAGLFVLPLLFVFLAVIILAAKTRKDKPIRVRYPWEDVFPDVVKLHEFPAPLVSRARSGSSGKKVSARSTPVDLGARLVLGVGLAILLLVGMLLLAQRLSGSFSYKSNMTTANASIRGTVIQPQSEKTENNNSGINAKVWFGNLAAGVSHSIKALPAKVWQLIAAAGLVALLIGALFYSSRTGQLSEVGVWFGGIIAAARDNFAGIIIAVFVIAALVSGYAFRKWLGAHLPGFAFVAGNLASLPSMARDFVLVYKFYILAGLFTLVAVLGFLVTTEKRGNSRKQQEGGILPGNSARKKNGSKYNESR